LDELVSAAAPLPDDHPVMVRRRRIAALVKVGKRVGYSALLVAIVVFFVGLATDFPTWTVDVIVIALVVSIVVLPAPIVFGYGIRAAEREERGGGSFH
jgi:hypothetical protein